MVYFLVGDKMSSGNLFTILSLFYIVILMVVYFSKKRINNLENKIYSCLIVDNFIGLVIAILCYYTVLNCEKIPLTNYCIKSVFNLFNKFYYSIFYIFDY